MTRCPNLRPLLIAVALLFCCVALAHSEGDACTLVWDPVTTNTDGSAATGVKYRVYLQAAGDITVQTIADTTAVTITQLCPAGGYWVTAYTPTSAESGKSNVVQLQQARPPGNLKWTK